MFKAIIHPIGAEGKVGFADSYQSGVTDEPFGFSCPWAFCKGEISDCPNGLKGGQRLLFAGILIEWEGA